MSDQDTSQVPGDSQRDDDRNDELEESPAPNPEEKAGEPTAHDDPQAD
jgi:hypothetical protein